MRNWRLVTADHKCAGSGNEIERKLTCACAYFTSVHSWVFLCLCLRLCLCKWKPNCIHDIFLKVSYLDYKLALSLQFPEEFEFSWRKNLIFQWICKGLSLQVAPWPNIKGTADYSCTKVGCPVGYSQGSSPYVFGVKFCGSVPRSARKLSEREAWGSLERARLGTRQVRYRLGR